MTLTQIYFLKALYQLQANQTQDTIFSCDRIISKLREIAPPEKQGEILEGLSALFSGDENPVKLFFCNEVMVNDTLHFTIDFDIGLRLLDYKLDYIASEEATKSYFQKYCPEAMDDYFAACVAYVNITAMQMPEEIVLLEDKEMDITHLIPQFKINVTQKDADIFVNAQEVCPIPPPTSDLPEIEQWITLEEVFKAVCNHILGEKKNQYGYLELIQDFFSRYSFPNEHKSNVIWVITKHNRTLVNLGYCYEYTAHALDSDGGIVPAQYFLRHENQLNENFFQNNIEELKLLHAQTITAIRTSFSQPLIFNAPSDVVTDTKYYDFESIMEKVTNFLTLSRAATNAVVIQALAKLVVKSPSDKYKSKDILRAIDDSFEPIKELVFFKNIYPQMVQRLLSCPYLFYARVLQETYFRVNVKKKFQDEDFTDPTGIRTTYDGMIETYNLIRSRQYCFEHLLHALYVYGIGENHLYVMKDNLKNIIENYGILEFSVLQTFMTQLCQSETLLELGDKYFFNFSSNAVDFIVKINPGLMDYYNTLHERQQAFTKAMQATATTKSEHKSGTGSTRVTQLGHSMFESSKKRKDFIVIDDEERKGIEPSQKK